MTAWTASNAPDYVPPNVGAPAWVWSVVGWGRNAQDGVDSIVLRLDYVQLDNKGMFQRVLNFRPGWSTGPCTIYMPLFLSLNEGDVGSQGSSRVGGYDYLRTHLSNGNVSTYDLHNTIWKSWIYKFLYGMRAVSPETIYIPLP